MRRRIFVSAVTRELGSYRRIVDECLRVKGDYEPVYQELLPHTDQSIAELLRDAIAKCDAAICLVGRKYGAAPRRPIIGYEDRSWAQLEYLFCRERAKARMPVFVFLASENVSPDDDVAETDDCRHRQEQFRIEVTDDRNYREFGSRDQLRAGVLALKFPWEDRAARWSRLTLAIAAVILIALGAVWASGRSGPLAPPVSEPVTATPRPLVQGPAEPRPTPPEPLSTPVWQQVNLRVAATETPEARERLPPALLTQIINGPLAFSGSDDDRRIDALRQAHGADNLPRELLFVCEIDSAAERKARLELPDLRGMAVLCEWCPATGEALPLRNKRVLFPEDLQDPNYQQYEFAIPSDAGEHRGWLAVWAFPLAAEALSLLGGDARFEPPHDSLLLMVVKPPWSLSWLPEGLQL